MTPDGRCVAFSSLSDNLVPGDTNLIQDVFVRDTQAQTTTLVSSNAVNWNGIYASNPNGSGSETPDITPDGRYVAYYSSAKTSSPGLFARG